MVHAANRQRHDSRVPGPAVTPRARGAQATDCSGGVGKTQRDLQTIEAQLAAASLGGKVASELDSINGSRFGIA